jgi:hypothetical protein
MKNAANSQNKTATRADPLPRLVQVEFAETSSDEEYESDEDERLAPDDLMEKVVAAAEAKVASNAAEDINNKAISSDPVAKALFRHATQTSPMAGSPATGSNDPKINNAIPSPEKEGEADDDEVEE